MSRADEQYRDNNLVKPDAAHAVIDLKFASVREGRGTDRRFGELAFGWSPGQSR
jgi:hypothetical protein